MPSSLSRVESLGPDDRNLLQLSNLSYEFLLFGMLNGILLLLSLDGVRQVFANLVSNLSVLLLLFFDGFIGLVFLRMDLVHDLQFLIKKLLCLLFSLIHPFV